MNSYMDFKLSLMSNKLYYVFLVLYILIIFINYKNLKNPRSYPPKKIREEFKRGMFEFNAYKYRGFSHYSLPRLVESEANWIDGYAYWNTACIKLATIGIIITIITWVLGEVFDLYSFVVGISIVLAYLISGMISISYRMGKSILKD